MIGCSNCGKENQDRYKFCLSCGTTLAKAQEKAAEASPKAASNKVCPSCQEENPASFVFCGRCGADLRKPREAKPPPQVRAVESPKSTTIDCPACGKENLSHYKYCLDCGADLHKKNEAPKELPKEEVQPTIKVKRRKNFQQPASISLQQGDGWLKLTYKPTYNTNIFKFFLAAAGLFGVSLFAVLDKGLSSGSQVFLLVVMLAGGLFFSIAAISMIQERVEIELEELSANTQGPFRESNSPTSREINVKTIASARPSYSCSCDGLLQIYCVKKFIAANNGRPIYDVTAVYHGGTAQVILAGVYDLATAQFIELTLERELKIEDHEVASEAS